METITEERSVLPLREKVAALTRSMWDHEVSDLHWRVLELKEEISFERRLNDWDDNTWQGELLRIADDDLNQAYLEALEAYAPASKPEAPASPPKPVMTVIADFIAEHPFLAMLPILISCAVHVVFFQADTNTAPALQPAVAFPELRAE